MRWFLRAAGVILPLLAFSTTTARAHAVLTGSSLGSGALRADHATTITLTFNAGIESGLSKVVLRGTGLDRPLPTRDGGSPNQVAVDVPALQPGPYVLHYKVLAMDGHVTESVLRFQVDDR